MILIKESKKITKFKLRGKKYLYTFKTADKGKASKLVASLPASNEDNKFLLFYLKTFPRLMLVPKNRPPKRRRSDAHSYFTYHTLRIPLHIIFPYLNIKKMSVNVLN